MTTRELLDALSLEALMLRLRGVARIAIPLVKSTNPEQIRPTGENNHPVAKHAIPKQTSPNGEKCQ